MIQIFVRCKRMIGEKTSKFNIGQICAFNTVVFSQEIAVFKNE